MSGIAFNEDLLHWVETITDLDRKRVRNAIDRVANWGINHIQRELLARPSIDSAVALTLLSEAVDKLQLIGTPYNWLMTKLRQDADVWPTWAELRAAALLTYFPEMFGSFQFKAKPKTGKHADFQITPIEGEGPQSIEFKAIGLSDEEVAFCGRMAPYLDELLPPTGVLTFHARLSQKSLFYDHKQLSYFHSQAEEWARSTQYFPRGLGGVAIVGHFEEANYARRLSLRLRGEIIRQIPRGERGWAAFYWTNGAQTNTICANLNSIWDEIPENIQGIILIGDAVHLPDPNIHSFRIILPRAITPESEYTVVSTVNDDLASLVMQRFEQSAGVRASIMAATTERGVLELLRRDGSRRILPFNLLMSPDPENAYPRTGGIPWDEEGNILEGWK